MTDFCRRYELPAAVLKADIKPRDLPFATTEDLEPFHGMLGQTRAQAALAFGVAMQRPGYNIYVMGEAGTGRLSFATQYFNARAKEAAASSDWLYLNNFEDPGKPLALRLPPGKGKTMVADMEAFIDNLLATFPAAFENPSYQRRRTAIDREFNQRYDQAIQQVERRARKNAIALFREDDVISFTPMIDGKPADKDAFAALPEERKQRFHENARELEDYLNELLMELPQWKRENIDKLRQLEQETIDQAVEPLLEDLRRKYADSPAALDYFAEMRRDLSRTVMEQLVEERGPESREDAGKRGLLVERYAPRLLVSHQPNAGSPVVYEPNPNYANLFGRIEYTNAQGALATHYRLLHPGALHQANGGFLILEAEKLVAEPLVWPALKRALKTRRIKIEPPAEEQMMPAMILDPEAVPLSVKIALVGSRELFDILQALDEEFDELFRVVAEFDDYFPRTPDSMLDFARLVKTHAEADGYKSLTVDAMVRLIEYSARLAEHQGRFSARLSDVFELVGEADAIRQREGDGLIRDRHIEKALAAKEERLGRMSRVLLDEMLAGTILIDTDGNTVGKINGLTILEAGDRYFGSPARITATVYPGDLGVIDIEREVELGQAIHSKGIMILSGYLGHKYARDFPLAISAHIALEQSYGYVDGDSASLAEVSALISALTGVPLAQSLAVTGSINQYGEVQAVGGVNEKIEGFFRLCQARGLTGRQGVIIPKANSRNLMLRDEVIHAVGKREFMIYTVHSVDETLELLTGQEVEKINCLAIARLRKIAKQAERKS
jgi:lon-related putative ATP-dependent protease